jgi:hypothetical protein
MSEKWNYVFSELVLDIVPLSSSNTIYKPFLSLPIPSDHSYNIRWISQITYLISMNFSSVLSFFYIQMFCSSFCSLKSLIYGSRAVAQAGRWRSLTAKALVQIQNIPCEIKVHVVVYVFSEYFVVSLSVSVHRYSMLIRLSTADAV